MCTTGLRSPYAAGMTREVLLGEVLEVLDQAFPPRMAEPWDRVGLVCGDREQPVRKALLAVDPAETVVDEAVELGVDLLLVHHPLLLRAVHSVSADGFKGRVLQRLVRHQIALYTAHTNADAAPGGANDALADLIGLTGTRPLQPGTEQRLSLVCYLPEADLDRALDAAAAAGAGTIGDYRRCGWSTTGTGTYQAGEHTHPVIGAAGEQTSTGEARLEMVLPAARAEQVLAAVRAAHPYEEPALHLLTQHPAPAGWGTGRVGTLPEPLTLRQLAERLAGRLPATAQGVRVSGPADAEVTTVALCTGSGDSLFAEARASGADVYVTADLRHHPACEAREHRRDGRPYLVDLSHWASEWPLLPRAAAVLTPLLGEQAVTVSTRRTDPWTFRV